MGKAMDITKLRQPIQQTGSTIHDLREATRGMSPSDLRQLPEYDALRKDLTPIVQELGQVAQAFGITPGTTSSTR